MTNCIFCKIVNREIPSELIFETDEVCAFYDVNPVAPIHVLVIPKKHYGNLEELFNDNPELSTKLLYAVKHIAKQLNINEEGYRLILNCGENGGQSVQHLHFHMIGGAKLNIHLV